jgi:hypothetical protein
MELLDIFAGYTIDLLSAIILFIFFNDQKLSFSVFCREKKKEIRRLSWGIIIISVVILIWALGYK